VEGIHHLTEHRPELDGLTLKAPGLTTCLTSHPSTTADGEKCYRVEKPHVSLLWQRRALAWRLGWRAREGELQLRLRVAKQESRPKPCGQISWSVGCVNGTDRRGLQQRWGTGEPPTRPSLGVLT
jgi:hypothetical protein